MASIPALEPFVIDGPPSALAARWKEWVDRLEIYFAATAFENDRRSPMLLHLGGAAVHKLGRSVVEEGPPYTYQSLKQELTAHFEPLVNPDYERFLLRQVRQFPHESVDAFYARLKDLARTCTLVDVEDEVRAQFIQGCTSVKLREHILQVPGMSMVNILTLGWSEELSKVRAAHMEAALQTQVKVDPVNAVTTAPGEGKKYKSKTPTSPHFCYSCRGPFPHQGRFKAVHSVQPVVVMDDDDLDNDESGEDFQVPIDISSWDQNYDDVTLQGPCLETNDVFPGGVLCPNMQSPDGSMALDHGTGQLVPMSSDVPDSGDHWVEEPITSSPGLAGRVTSTHGDGPYNLRPRPQ
ncbi:hypothetical protein NDU88_002699 [Pleurodeles waltl]|uniref:Retrotransposon gag domain-containing protein n=1 Tax=Pleurodeles waltl TaxID=8319 RepID=A0AAV7VBA6_PLEWA|nr:hypothetical protein NDU88_002699 [Pleurodeles waltl]